MGKIIKPGIVMKKLFLITIMLSLASCSKDSSNSLLEFENTPPLINPQSFNIDEHAPEGTLIGVVSASDIDDDQLTFSIETQNGLVINESTGEISTSDELVLDYEAIQSIAFTVSVFDGQSISEQTFTLDINDIDEYSLLSTEQQELISYFQYLTLWKAPTHGAPLEFSSRWKTPVRLFLDGNLNNEFRTNVDASIAEYNEIFANSDFNIELVETLAEANTHLFYGEMSEVENLWPDMFEVINGGSYSGYAITSNNTSILNDARMWISNSAEVLFKHELGHVLGFGHSDKCDSEKSFLCSSIALDHDFLEIEKSIIEYAYDNDFSEGLNEEEIQLYLANKLYMDL